MPDRRARGAVGGAGGVVDSSALDAILPSGEVLSRHRIRIAATRERVWDSLLAQDLAASGLSRALLFLRGYGGRVAVEGHGTFPERLERFGFTRLEELPGRELVFGLAGRFWRPDGGLRRIADRAAFLAFADDGCVKAAWNLRIGDSGGGSCDLSTETRVEFFGASARRKFRIYWMLVGPFSGMLRRSLLRGVKRRAEDGANGGSRGGARAFD
jgi:hypothetical protein